MTAAHMCRYGRFPGLVDRVHWPNKRRDLAVARAVSWDEAVDLMAVMFPSEEEAYRIFEPRPTDVVISPFAKCGTTWLQQIVHSLRTGGDMDFEDIYEVVPFIDIALEMGIDLNGEHKANPRVFKSHGSWDEVPRGCRYIVSFRDPQDAVVSFYHFFTGWIIEPGAIPIDEFVAYRAFDRDRGADYWRHLASWLGQRDNPDVLLLTFEEMKADLPRVVERIAGFVGIEDRDAIDAAIYHSSYEFMASNSAAFSEPWMRAHLAEVAGIPFDSEATKVRQGRVGQNRQELATATRERLDEIWAKTIGTEFGYASYDDLDAAMRAASAPRT
jgi:hypothetical protein